MRYITCTCLLCTLALHLRSQSARIDSTLLDELATKGYVDCFVVMRKQANVSAAKALPDKQAKGRFVYAQLQATAKETQHRVRSLLQAERALFRPFFIVNAIFVKNASSALIWRLAQLPEVAQILPNPQVKMADPIPAPAIRGPQAIEWGIEQINAPQAWASGYEGQGVVIGGQDTGYDWLHPALKTKYRGYYSPTDTIDHNYNWHDAIHEISPLHGDSVPDPSLNPCGLDAPAPCDDHNHGTHTMGIMVGSDGDNQIGVAPQAQWIGCRNMERGYGSPYTYLECFEWFLAPTDLNGQNPNTDLAPHVINNSWACPPIEGCHPGNFFLLETAVNNLDMAGIVVVVSAGNSGGSGCGTVNAPAAIFEHSFSVGATDANDYVAGFSSRGPVTVDSSFRRKPDVVAPGVSIRSSIRNGAYATFSGTSMAGPHVAGTIALMLSARPELSGHTQLIKDILQQTAIPLTDSVSCGGWPGDSIPNNTAGYGRIDAWAAVQMALNWQLTPTIEATSRVEVQVFPNPTTGPLFFLWPKTHRATHIYLYDAMGRMVQMVKPDIHTYAAQLFLPNNAVGIWFYLIEGPGWQARGKVIRSW